LRSALKTNSQTAEEFANNLETVNKLTDWMPGNAPLLTQEELKTACCNGSPQAWKMAFDQAGKNILTTEHPELLSHVRGRETDSNNRAQRNKQVQRERKAHCQRDGGQGNGCRRSSQDDRTTTITTAPIEMFVLEQKQMKQLMTITIVATTQIGIHHTSGENASSIRPKGQKTVALPCRLASAAQGQARCRNGRVEVEEETTVEEAKETKVPRTTPA
jgi:hypothetical protein